MCLPLRPPLQFHSTLQLGHSSLRTAGASLLRPPPGLTFLQCFTEAFGGRGGAPLLGEDYLTGPRSSHHPGASWAVDRDRHNCPHPAWEEEDRRGTPDPNCLVLVHWAGVHWRRWPHLLLVETPSRKDATERWTSRGGALSPLVPGGGKGGAGLDGGPPGIRGGQPPEANKPLAPLSSPKALQRLQFRTRRSFPGCSEKCP